MFWVSAICFIFTECVLSIQTLLINLYVYVLLDPLLDQDAIWIPYLIKWATLLNKQMWFYKWFSRIVLYLKFVLWIEKQMSSC